MNQWERLNVLLDDDFKVEQCLQSTDQLSAMREIYSKYGDSHMVRHLAADGLKVALNGIGNKDANGIGPGLAHFQRRVSQNTVTWVPQLDRQADGQPDGMSSVASRENA